MTEVITAFIVLAVLLGTSAIVSGFGHPREAWRRAGYPRWLVLFLAIPLWGPVAIAAGVFYWVRIYPSIRTGRVEVHT